MPNKQIMNRTGPVSQGEMTKVSWKPHTHNCATQSFGFRTRVNSRLNQLRVTVRFGHGDLKRLINGTQIMRFTMATSWGKKT